MELVTKGLHIKVMMLMDLVANGDQEEDTQTQSRVMLGNFDPPLALASGVGGGGGFSGVDHWATYRSHGDVFPVAPDWIECGVEQSGVYC